MGDLYRTQRASRTDENGYREGWIVELRQDKSGYQPISVMFRTLKEI